MGSIACQIITWLNVLSLNKALSEISEIGFDGVELTDTTFQFYDMSANEIRENLALNKLKAVGIYCNLLLSDHSKDREEECAFRKQIHNAQALDVQTLVIGNPPFRNDTDNKGAIATICKRLNALGQMAREEGIKLSYQSHYGSPVESREEIEFMLGKTDPEKVGFCFDSAHLTLGGLDPASFIKEHADRIQHIQLKDVRTKSRSFFERLQLFYRYLNLMNIEDYKEAFRPIVSRIVRYRAPDFVELGSGVIDFDPIWQAIRSSAYKGWITLELDSPSLLARQNMNECFLAFKEMRSRCD